ncbi:MAG: hypothetical protein ACLQVL_22545 [Terriglobia bacterium]
MNSRRGIKYSVRGLLRVLPSFMILAFCSASLAWLVFRVPLKDVPVAAGVPMVCLSVLRRLLSAFLVAPDPKVQEAKGVRPMPKWFLPLGLIITFSVFLGTGMMVSSLIYQWLSFPAFSLTAFHVSVGLLTAGAVAFTGTIAFMIRVELWKLVCWVADIAREALVEIPRQATDFVQACLQTILHSLTGGRDSLALGK